MNVSDDNDTVSGANDTVSNVNDTNIKNRFNPFMKRSRRRY